MTQTYTRRWFAPWSWLRARHSWHVHGSDGQPLLGRLFNRHRVAASWRETSTPELHSVAESPSQLQPARVAAIEELAGRVDADLHRLWALRHEAKDLVPHIVLRLAQRGFAAAREPLAAILPLSEPSFTSAAAAALKNQFADNRGLDRLAVALRSDGELIFLEGWHLFRSIWPARRDAHFVRLVGQALVDNQRADRCAGLLYLLLEVDASRDIGPWVLPFLGDRRRARLPVLQRRVRIHQLAADCLLVALHGSEPPPTSRPSRRELQRSLKSAEAWYELCDRFQDDNSP